MVCVKFRDTLCQHAAFPSVAAVATKSNRILREHLLWHDRYRCAGRKRLRPIRRFFSPDHDRADDVGCLRSSLARLPPTPTSIILSTIASWTRSSCHTTTKPPRSILPRPRGARRVTNQLARDLQYSPRTDFIVNARLLRVFTQKS